MKTIKLFVVIAILFIFSPVSFASAMTLETLQVSSLSQTPIYSDTILELGKMYVLEVNGTYTFAPGNRNADAEFAYNPDTDLWYEELEVENKEFNLDLFVNGQPQDWLGSSDGQSFYQHTYSPNHIYRLTVIGQGQPVAFKIYDSSYDWNEGYLSVSISKLLPTNKSECKEFGWRAYSETLRNQGTCIKSVLSK